VSYMSDLGGGRKMRVEAAVTRSREKRRRSSQFRPDFGELRAQDQTIGTRGGWGSGLRC
jgi:hypothetical protein